MKNTTTIFCVLFSLSIFQNIDAQLLEDYIIGCDPISIFIEDNYLYYSQNTPGTNSKISRQNIGPGFPVVTDILTLSSDNGIFGMEKNGNNFYYVQRNYPAYTPLSIYKFDMTDPLGTNTLFSAPGNLNQLVNHGGSLYASVTDMTFFTNNAFINKYNISTPAPASPISTISLPTGIHSLHKNGSTLYAGGKDGKIYSRSLLVESPFSLIYTSPIGQVVTSMTTFEGLIYYTDNWGIHRFDPMAIIPVAETIADASEFELFPWDIAIKQAFSGEKYLYVVDYHEKIMRMNLNDICTASEVPALSSSTEILCEDSLAIITIDGELNGASAWYVYKDSCDGSFIGSTASSNIVVSPDAPSTTFFVRGEGGCITIPESCATITLNVSPSDDANFVYTGTSFCLKDEDPIPIILGTADGVFTNELGGLSINEDSGEVNLSESSAGTHIVKYTTTGACPAYSEFELTLYTLDLSISGDDYTLIAADSLATYQWINCDDDNSLIIGATEQSYLPTGLGNFAVILDNGFCLDTSECVSITSVGFEKHDLQVDYDFRIFPNPTKGIFTIDFGSVQKGVSLSIIDVSGNVLFSKDFQYLNQLTLDLSLKNGLYFIEFITDDQKRTTKKIEFYNN